MSAIENNSVPSGQPSLSKQDLSTLDVTKLTALSPEVISRQATINIGTIGHVAHGKSTVVKAVSGVQTVRFKNELERNITIKLENSADHQSVLLIPPLKECRVILRDVLKDPSILAENNYKLSIGTSNEKKKSSSKKKRRPEDDRSVMKKKKKTVKTEKNCDSDEFEVEAILDCSCQNNVYFYLIKWKGWRSEYNTWEPVENLLNSFKLLSNFFHSSTEYENISAEVEELRNRLKSDEELTDILDNFRDGNKWLKFPSVDHQDTESLLRGIIKFSINDPVLIKKVQQDLQLLKVLDLRKTQLRNLKDWECEINQHSTSDFHISVENNFDLEGPPKDFFYINDYIPGKNVVISDEPPLGCNCQPLCSKTTKGCCGQVWNREFSYGAFNKLRVPLGTPIYECNKRCTCPPDCPNRVVQNGAKVRFCIFRTNKNCGWGLKTLDPIKRGKFVAIYVGEVITSDEAELRGRQYDQEGSTYLFDLDFNDKDNAVYTVDAGRMGNVSHFINHSCDPNLHVYAVWINCLDPDIPYLALFACKDIKAGEELSFDYLCQNLSSKADIRDISADTDKRRTLCQCSSENCRKFLF